MLRQVWLKLGTAAFWLCWPGLFVFLRRTHRTRVIVRAGGQILLVRSWLSDGHWGLPGGGLHRHEATIDGAIRELHEETGIALVPTQLKELTTEPLVQRGLACTCTYLLADITETIPTQDQRGEITDSRWFRLGQVGGAGFQPEVHRALRLLVEHGLF